MYRFKLLLSDEYLIDSITKKNIILDTATIYTTHTITLADQRVKGLKGLFKKPRDT